ncbi:MAG: TauD/TfdA family dioxygenase [Acidimicrobiia bacterium]
MSVTTSTLTPYVGIEVRGLKGPDLVDPARAAELLALLGQHGVIVFPQIGIADADLVAFSRLLGEVTPNPTAEHEFPEIATITLDPAKTRELLAWYRQGNFIWHIDGATEALPQKATLLSAQQVDDGDGGDTEFASTYAAYDALPDDEKAHIADLQVLHSFAAAQLRAHPDPTDEERAGWDRVPTRVHPLVWSRRDGRKSLLLGATAQEVVGMDPDEGRALLRRLEEWSTQPQFVLRHRWTRGDLVMFDNTGLLHRACPFEPTSPRLMHRTTLVGVEPVTAEVA